MSTNPPVARLPVTTANECLFPGTYNDYVRMPTLMKFLQEQRQAKGRGGFFLGGGSGAGASTLTLAYDRTTGLPIPGQVPMDPAQPNNQLTSLAAYYRFDEASGTRYDVNGANALAEVLPPVASIAGKIGNAIRIDVDTTGNGLLASAAPYAPCQFDGPFSVAFWFRDTTFNCPMLGYGGGIGGYDQFVLTLQSGIGAIAFAINNGAGGFLGGSTSVADGTWHHIVVTYDPTGMNLYVDGTLNATATAPASIPAPNPAWTFWIGGTASSFSPPDAFDFDEMGIWNRALALADVQSLYNGGAGKTYPF